MTALAARIRMHLLTMRDSLVGVGVTGIDPARFIDALLVDVSKFEREEGDDLLTLTDAAEECGYSADHLGALVRSGKLANYGRKLAPRVKASELPRKARSLTLGQSRANVRVQIAREVAHSAPRRGNAQA